MIAAIATALTIAVIDADTLRVDGDPVRIIGLDAPESGARAKCDAERMLAAVATAEAERIVASETVRIAPSGDIDVYGRTLAVVTIGADAMDWGDHMIARGLAVAWEGKRHAWCRRR